MNPVWGTSFVEVPFEDAVQDAPLVVRGAVGARFSDWGLARDGRRRIYTYYELIVSERLKGDSGEQRLILMRELGGEVDGVGMQVSGVAQFQPDEEVVVFLSPGVPDAKGRTAFDVRGMMMGKFTVKTEEGGDEVLDGAGTSALEHPLHRQVRRELEAQGDTKPAKKWTLGALRQLIASQGGATPPAPFPGVSVASPSPVPSALPPSLVEGSASSLQPSSDEEGGSPLTRNWLWLLLGGGVALILLSRYRR